MNLFEFPEGMQTRWSSFENLQAAKGAGGKSNRGGKGASCLCVHAGETQVLLDAQGPGVVRRIWLTVSKRTPEMLRSLRIDCYWDGAATPAVSAPLGDFFGVGLGRMSAFECDLFASPEARSFVSYLPMPFRNNARITLTNESPHKLDMLFFDINYTLEPVSAEALYLHAIFRRENPTTLRQDFEILPRVQGRGRYLGTNLGVIANPLYDGSWWGEGEVKCYLDGDQQWPTLCGTGTEDYIGTGWGQKVFAQRYHGATIGDEANRQWAYYRYHVVDPIVFAHDCRVTIQQMGGTQLHKFLTIRDRGAAVEAATAQGVLLLEPGARFQPHEFPQDAWVNFFREDDVSAVAYFYLDRPENGLPAMPQVALRTIGLTQAEASKRLDG